MTNAGLPAGASVTIPAPAKLNAVLRVLGTRPDGYHEVASLLLPLFLVDTVTVAVGGVPGPVTCEVGGSGAAEVPAGSGNLAVRAAEVFLAEAFPGDRPAIAVTIEKRIPVAAGLGGGSADAAAVLRALDRLAPDAVPASRLVDLAAGLGADVPALLHGGPVMVAGRGERVRPVPPAPGPTWWALRPFEDLRIAAADAYRWWDGDGDGDPAPATPDTATNATEAFAAGDPERLGAALANDLQAPIVARHPQVAGILAAFEEAGALGAIVSGSGPTVVALARDEQDAGRIAAAVPGAIVVRSMPVPA